MAALSGLQIDNALIEIDGPETPIMDGSAADFVAAIDRAGVVRQARARRFLKVLKPVRVDRDGGYAELLPAERGFRLDVEIDFASPAIGRQRLAFTLDPASFRREIARARTFGFVSDVKKLWQAGYALGSSLENSVAIDNDEVLNPEGLRYADEFVRHKALDAVGDLSLAGAPIVGVYRTYRPGHKLNALALEALFADRSAYAFVEGATAKPLKGVGVMAPFPPRPSSPPSNPPTGMPLAATLGPPRRHILPPLNDPRAPRRCGARIGTGVNTPGVIGRRGKRRDSAQSIEQKSSPNVWIRSNWA